MKPIILLSGPPGAGKTTVGRELAALSEGPLSYIEGDTFWSFIAKRAPNRPGGQDFKMIMTAMTVAAIPYATNGYEVILDFSIPPWFLGTVQKLAGLREVPLDYVVLRPAKEICAARAAARTEGQMPDYSRYEDLYADFDKAKRYMIRNDDKTPAATAALIRHGLDEGSFRLTAHPRQE